MVGYLGKMDCLFHIQIYLREKTRAIRLGVVGGIKPVGFALIENQITFKFIRHFIRL